MNYLINCMKHIGYNTCLADPDLWIKAEVQKDDCKEYYAHAFLYVDDVLSIHHNPEYAKEIEQVI